MINIDHLQIGQTVQIRETGELGTVERIDYDDNLIWVKVDLGEGRTDTIDIDPGDLS